MANRLGLSNPRWKISAAALEMLLDCTPHGIGSRCLGKCCTNTFWPGMAEPKPNGYCHYHVDGKGCRLTVPQKPITCLLYPLKFMARTPLYRATLIRHFRNTVICKDNINATGTPLVELFAETFIHIFGEAQYTLMVKAIKEHRRFVYMDVPPNIYKACQNEMELEAKNQLPKPRRTLNVHK